MQMVVKTTVDNGTPATETLNFAYDASGSPMAVSYNGTTYYYVTNMQGDVTALLDSTGTAVVSYTYDAWGNILSITGPMADTLGADNPLLYRGYVYDSETDLYYLQSRYYNPEIGRFINADALISTGQGLLGNNMFVYCNNNPIEYTDVSGHLPRGNDGIMNPNMMTFQNGIYWGWITPDPPNIIRELEETKDVTVGLNPNGREVTINNSYKIRDSKIIREYATYLVKYTEYGNLIDGSIDAIVLEWQIHNLAYDVFWFWEEQRGKAKNVDIARTIYNDDHGALSYLMCALFWITSPFEAIDDLAIYWEGK